MRILLTAVLGIFISTIHLHAQAVPQAADPERFTSKELKQIEKSKVLYNKGKYEKAITVLSGPQSTHLLNSELWTLHIIYANTLYQEQYRKDIMALSKALGGGKKTIVFSSYIYKEKLLNACYLATLYCKDQENAAILLRSNLVDFNPDSSVSSSAKKAFNDGEEAFQQGKFEQAVRGYKRAYVEDSTYYKAVLYIGDSYYRDKEYALALPWYKKAVDMQPQLLEGWKYLTDVYGKLHRYQEAYDACIEGITVYPDVGMFIKLEDACEHLDKTFKQHWLPRFCIPNSPALTQSAEEKGPWKYYRDAKGEVTFGDNGILKQEKEGTKYLEVYSWKYMLKKDGNATELDFAKEMEAAGYLDCYVFVSMFHYSFYEQYADFAKDNKARIRTYISTQLVK